MAQTMLHVIGEDATSDTLDRFELAAAALAGGASGGAGTWESGKVGREDGLSSAGGVACVSHRFVILACADGHPAARERLQSLERGELRGAFGERVSAPLGREELASIALRKLIHRETAAALHVWSPLAARACYETHAGRIAGRFGLHGQHGTARSATKTPIPLFIDATCLAERRARQQITAGSRSTLLCEARFICTTNAEVQKLAQVGISAAQCAIAPTICARRFSLPTFPLSHLPTHQNNARAAIREKLALRAGERAIVVLPPIDRDGGAFLGSWATLVLEKLRRELRLVVPGVGPEAERLMRLVHSIEHDPLVRFPGVALSLDDILSVADAAVLATPRPASLHGLAAAMLAGMPIVATDVCDEGAILREGENAWLCPPGDPRAAARRLLELIERPEEAKRRAENAQKSAAVHFDPEKARLAWLRLYKTPPAIPLQPPTSAANTNAPASSSCVSDE